MKVGYLSQYFEAVAAKRLTSVETDITVSHQHEYNGSKALKAVLGTFDTGETLRFTTSFIWMAEENETIITDGQLSWYNSRINKDRAPEWRLFYPKNDVTLQAKEGDLMFIAKRTDGTIMNILVSGGSTAENQLLWLFDVPVQTGKVFVYNDINQDDKEVDFAVRIILDELGIDVEEPEADRLDGLLERFKGMFPTTKEFSLYARQTIDGVDPIGEPDRALMEWMEQEEKLFRRLERQIVQKRLQSGFMNEGETDIDGFIGFSLSVQNRRKSRAGLALENHLEVIFQANELTFSRVAVTENKSKPDFLFPSTVAYHSLEFPDPLLTMLGVKTTCKDRWRQVLSEAARIPQKHLLTLEPGISDNQTNEMRASGLQLVLPQSIHETYSQDQRGWLMNFTQFIDMAKGKQAGAKGYY